MASTTSSTGGFSVTAHVGDFKTLLAFSFDAPGKAKDLAGFSIQVKPAGQAPYYLWNTLGLRNPGPPMPGEPPQSTANAPVQRFRWVHVPGSVHQGLAPFQGDYTYTVTPRFFGTNGHLQPLDPSRSVNVTVPVQPFGKNGCLAVAFTRGYSQSEAFVHHFSRNAALRPDTEDVAFDTSRVAGQNAKGADFTFGQMYEWGGFTARKEALDFLDAVIADPEQRLDAFCYDLNDPDVCRRLLQLAAQGRVRVILDDAALHVLDKKTNKESAEDLFEQQFRKVCTGAADILRGHFGRYAHDKVFVAFTQHKWLRVLTGSTNFSITGFTINSNHLLVIDDAEVAEKYGALFETVWAGQVKKAAYLKTAFATLQYRPTNRQLPIAQITFAPHTPDVATSNLQAVAERVLNEKHQVGNRSVMFAVMETAQSQSPVIDALKTLPQDSEVFTYGITDSQGADGGISLYKPGSKQGVVVTGKPGSAVLPPPFDQFRFVSGVGHQVHHKFVVCGFNGPAPTVFCGSSNLAVGGESNNGDNLIEIRDADVATAFAIEAIGLVDHFLYLNKLADKKPGGGPIAQMPSSKSEAAQRAGWFLATDDLWAQAYFDPNDLKCVERVLLTG